MKEDKSNIYEFGGFRLDVGRRLLLRCDDGEPLKLTSKAFDTLLYLVRHGGTVLDKDELMRAVWPDTVVEENNLSQNVSALRRALGEKQGENRYIVTVPGRGFSFVASVTELTGETPSVIEGELPELRSEEVSNFTGPARDQSIWNRTRFIILGVIILALGLDIAQIYAGLGDKEQAFAWLEKADEGRSRGMDFLDVNPAFDTLRLDPRFGALTKRRGRE